MAKKHTKRCSTLLIIREMQKKIQQGLTSHHSEWSRSLEIVNAGEDVEKRELSNTKGAADGWMTSLIQ